MSLMSKRIGRGLEDRISAVEGALQDAIGASADHAREATRRSAFWAARGERAALKRSRELQRRMERNKQAIESSAVEAAAGGYRFIKERPWAAIGLTAAVATALGMLLVKRE